MEPNSEKPNDGLKGAGSESPLVPDIDPTQVAHEVLEEKIHDMLLPGFEAEFSPEEAERLGAFREDALSAADALESTPESEGVAGSRPVTIMKGLAAPVTAADVAGVTRRSTGALAALPHGVSFAAVLDRLEGRLRAAGGQ